MNEKNIDNDCPVWRTMQIMGSKWAMLILFHLSKKTFRYISPPKRKVQNTQNKYLKNTHLPKSVKNEKYNNLNFG